MLAGKAAAFDAVWHSNRDGKSARASFLKVLEPRKAEPARPKRPSSKYRVRGSQQSARLRMRVR